MTLLEQAQTALSNAGMSVEIIAPVIPMAPIVSPMCRAADWAGLVVTTTEGAMFVKLRAPDAADFVTVVDAAHGARLAANLGVGPELRFSDVANAAMGFEFLAAPWREAFLSDLSDLTVLNAVLQAKRRLHTGSALPRTWDVFAEIEKLAAEVSNGPANLPRFLQTVTEIKAALQASGQDSRPGHCDGVVSNIMVNPAGDVRLVDYDCAGMADPYYDIGVVLNEACQDTKDWQAGIEMAFGQTSPTALNRCQLYAIADDLLWGLWGLSRHAVSARTDLEYLKYARWRLLRCGMALRRGEFADQMHHL